jgi:hypothetical protein
MRGLTTRECTLLIGGACLILLVLAGEKAYRLWFPKRVLESAHYRIRTTATETQAARVAGALELLHDTYRAALAPALPAGERAGKYQVDLYRDRTEFRRVNKGVTWAEAFYLTPVIHAYYAEAEASSAEFFTHEGVHQLNEELGGFRLWKWLSEGLACYYSATRVVPGRRLDPRLIDLEAYPAYWIYTAARTGDPREDTANGSFIPLATLIEDRGGPDIDEHFNLYYVHWWTLVYFLHHFADGRYADRIPALVREGGSLPGFERIVGPVQQVEREWYAFLVELRKGVQDGTAPLWKPEAKSAAGR